MEKNENRSIVDTQGRTQHLQKEDDNGRKREREKKEEERETDTYVDEQIRLGS